MNPLDIDWSQVKLAIDMFKASIGLVKDAKDLLPDGTKKEAITKSLEEAERTAKLAEAQIAKSLGYHLCQCTFPPQIMLSIGYQGTYEKFKCPGCTRIYPSESFTRPIKHTSSPI